MAAHISLNLLSSNLETEVVRDCFHCGNPTDRVFCPVCDFELTKSAGKARLAKLQKAAELVGVPPHLSETQLNANDKSRTKDWAAGTGLMIFGPAGSGKSRLAAGLTIERLEKTAKIMPHHVQKWWSPVVYVRASALLNRVRAGIRENDSKPIMPFVDPTFLVIDDFGFENPSDWAMETWLNLFDMRNGRRNSTVVVSQYNSKDIAKLYGDPVADRLRRFTRVILRGKNGS